MGDIPAPLPDLATLFTAGEMALPASLNGEVDFHAVLVNFSVELPGQTVGITGSAPYLIAPIADIPGVTEGDEIIIDGVTWYVHEVRPDNTGVVRLTVENLS